MTSASESSRSGWRRGFDRLRSGLVGAASWLLFAAHVAAAATPTDDEATRTAARELAREGLVALNEERYAQAESRFRRALELVPAATVAVLRGRALEPLDRLVEARDAYQLALRLGEEPNAPSAYREAAREAEVELGRLLPLVPHLTVVVVGVAPSDAALMVAIDDTPLSPSELGVARSVDPGQHLILVSYRKIVRDARWVTLTRGGRATVPVRVDLGPAREPPKPDELARWRAEQVQRRFGWTAAGAGALGLAVGVVSGVMMLGYEAELAEGCRPYCPPALEPELRGFRTARTVSAVGYGVSLLGIGLGTGMVLATPSRRGPPPGHGVAPATRRPPEDGK